MEVVGDEGVELALGFQSALDKVGAAAFGGVPVGDADDPVDPLAVQDALALGDGVARQLGPQPDEGRGAGPKRWGRGSSTGRGSW